MVQQCSAAIVTIYAMFACVIDSSCCCRVEGGRDSRFHRSSRHSGSPPRRRESDRRRSTSRPPAAHKASRSSSHRQPDNRWTRSQGHSTGGAASPAHSEDDGYQPYERVSVITSVTTVSVLTCVPSIPATQQCNQHWFCGCLGVDIHDGSHA